MGLSVLKKRVLFLFQVKWSSGFEYVFYVGESVFWYLISLAIYILYRPMIFKTSQSSIRPQDNYHLKKLNRKLMPYIKKGGIRWFEFERSLGLLSSYYLCLPSVFHPMAQFKTFLPSISCSKHVGLWFCLPEFSLVWETEYFSQLSLRTPRIHKKLI